ncbi:hypothetical protein VKT23_001275 [Stygiomarasmius scandens]|uniref:Uncharacterized protein n=1 Tax=Marasmiellus scandens TaxID=2682957 RepID=A0ABR1KCH7_9AGAR
MAPITTIVIPIPSSEDIGHFFVNALGALDKLAVNHHVGFALMGAVLFFTPEVFTWPFWPFKKLYQLCLRCFGFGSNGVRSDSFASHYQSTYYGGYIPAESYFSEFQSHGATFDEEEYKAPLYARILSWGAGILAVRSLFL